MEIIRNLQNSLTTPGSSLHGRDKIAFGKLTRSNYFIITLNCFLNFIIWTHLILK